MFTRVRAGGGRFMVSRAGWEVSGVVLLEGQTFTEIHQEMHWQKSGQPFSRRV